MKLENLSLYDALRAKGVTHLFHANTVATSISFILAGGLLSRGDVERRHAFQTEQPSDNKDKRFDVWFDVFLDFEDLHQRFQRPNWYGPVLFKFSIDCLLDDRLDVWITRRNPAQWEEGWDAKERYFQDVAGVQAAWDEAEPQQRMLTIRKPGRPVLFQSLESIVIDDYGGEVYEGWGIRAGGVMQHSLFAATESCRDLRRSISSRECIGNCYCAHNYEKERSDFQRMHLFCPRDLIHLGVGER